MNAQEDVRTLPDDALERCRLEMKRDTVDRRRLSRLALIAAARAYEIDARREEGNYTDGWPTSADISLENMPSLARAAAGAAPERSTLVPTGGAHDDGDDQPGLQLPDVLEFFHGKERRSQDAAPQSEMPFAAQVSTKKEARTEAQKAGRVRRHKKDFQPSASSRPGSAMLNGAPKRQVGS